MGQRVAGQGGARRARLDAPACVASTPASQLRMSGMQPLISFTWPGLGAGRGRPALFAATPRPRMRGRCRRRPGLGWGRARRPGRGAGRGGHCEGCACGQPPQGRVAERARAIDGVRASELFFLLSPSPPAHALSLALSPHRPVCAAPASPRGTPSRALPPPRQGKPLLPPPCSRGPGAAQSRPNARRGAHHHSCGVGISAPPPSTALSVSADRRPHTSPCGRRCPPPPSHAPSQTTAPSPHHVRPGHPPVLPAPPPRHPQAPADRAGRVPAGRRGRGRVPRLPGRDAQPCRPGPGD